MPGTCQVIRRPHATDDVELFMRYGPDAGGPRGSSVWLELCSLLPQHHGTDHRCRSMQMDLDSITTLGAQ